MRFLGKQLCCKGFHYHHINFSLPAFQLTERYSHLLNGRAKHLRLARYRSLDLFKQPLIDNCGCHLYRFQGTQTVPIIFVASGKPVHFCLDLFQNTTKIMKNYHRLAGSRSGGSSQDTTGA